MKRCGATAIWASPFLPNLHRSLSQFRDRSSLLVENLLERALVPELLGILHNTTNLVIQELLRRSQQFQKPLLFFLDDVSHTFGTLLRALGKRLA